MSMHTLAGPQVVASGLPERPHAGPIDECLATVASVSKEVERYVKMLVPG